MGSIILSNSQMLKKIFHQSLTTCPTQLVLVQMEKKCSSMDNGKKFMSGQLQLLGIYPQRLLMKEVSNQEQK